MMKLELPEIEIEEELLLACSELWSLSALLRNHNDLPSSSLDGVAARLKRMSYTVGEAVDEIKKLKKPKEKKDE